jgi:hypothetical protein
LLETAPAVRLGLRRDDCAYPRPPAFGGWIWHWAAAHSLISPSVRATSLPFNDFYTNATDEMICLARGRAARASALCGAVFHLHAALMAVALPVHRAANGSTSTVCRLASYSTSLTRRPPLQGGLRHRTVSAARLEGSQPLLTLKPAENEALPHGVTEGGKFAGMPVSLKERELAHCYPPRLGRSARADLSSVCSRPRGVGDQASRRGTRR